MTGQQGVSHGRAASWWLAAGLLGAAGIALRFWGLDRQSYWTDETFSVLQSSGSWQHLIDVARTEIHPPLYPALLKIWIELGGTGPVWTRSLGALLGALGVLASWLILRRTSLGVPVRSVIVAVTAASGFAITYAQEARPYALLWLASVGVTAAAWAWLDGPGRGRLVSFVLWGLVASGAHLFGALLVAGLTLVVVLLRRQEVLLGIAAAGIASLPLVAWLAIGLTTPGFAAGAARWIAAPTASSLADLFTTTFAAGDVHMLDEGFVWRAPWLAVVVACTLAIAAAVALRHRVDPATPELRAAGFFGGVAVLLVVGTWLTSQLLHLWTLRNMIVVTPALSWAVVCAAGGLVRERALRSAALIVLLLGNAVALIPVQQGISEPYKTDFAGSMEYLAQVRTEHPDAHFVISTENPEAWMLSANLRQDPGYLQWLLGDAELIAKDEFSSVLRQRDGVSVFVWYRSTDPLGAAGRTAAMLRRLGSDACRPVHLQGVAVVRCDRAG